MTDIEPSDGPPERIVRLKGRQIVIDRPLLMGVVNASPESFSDAGRYQSLDQRLERCHELVEAGAAVIDIGGQSAITNQPELAAEIEAERVVPIVEWMSKNHPSVLVSVDTYKPLVVEATLRSGASIINDVSGLLNPEVASIAAAHSAALVIMHTAALPKVRKQDRHLYGDVTAEVVDFLRERMELAIEAGLPLESLILDPGPDFTKTPHQTVELLRHIDAVRALGRPLLLALSRKDFLGAITGRRPKDRDAATHAALALFASQGGSIMRVHDVAAARDVVATVDVLTGLRDLDPDYVLADNLRHEPQANLG